ncbi:LysR family transcriptional regulator [Hyalangium rubrum]|uniref:LysR family transcriptional regulator n=1 Tax=Hyalangium rubrum TaxID=3103134 RepID=A0ABU5H3K6_9BACT|nr:LysR family transcriptional regulator [Hyalangium sp. s54d21]MDY7227383.1 LysR family transcriptional regulator [Hyalangium sp. s54d21]
MFDPVNDMLVFAAVARAGSITRAGKALRLPKSTVSRRMASLEERLGTRLLLKSTRRLVLTQAGEAFLERCLRLADEVDDVLAFASGLDDQPRGMLRVTMPPDFGDLVLVDAIASFTARYPEIQLVLDESQRYVDLIAERFDLALRAGVLPDSSLVARRLMTLESGIFASPSYLARWPAPRTPGELASHNFVILEGRTRFDRLRLHSGQRRVEAVLEGTLTVSTSRMQLRLGLAGAGAIVYPGRYCEDAVREGRLVRLLPEWSTEPAPIWLVTPSGRLLPRKTVLFIEHVLTAVK